MPFKVPDPEFKGRVFVSVEEYNLAKVALTKRKVDCNIGPVCLHGEPSELVIEAELKDTSNRLGGVELELRNFRDRVESLLSGISKSLEILLKNHDGIPYMTKLKAVSTVKGKFPKGKSFDLLVTTGGYKVDDECYKTLSAAAEGVSGNRRNGWEWWKTENGLTAKEALRSQSWM